MSLAPWRSPLARALHRNRSLAHARYLQLATVQPNGHPANRTVVFRGFLEATNQLAFVTDARSDKRIQITHLPYGEACWYFPKTREQFRLTGPLNLIQAACSDRASLQARQAFWQGLSDAARTQFMWPHPKQPRASTGFAPTLPDPASPPEHFCLLLLDPAQVDHLELRGEPQNRWLYQRSDDETWSMQAVNP